MAWIEEKLAHVYYDVVFSLSLCPTTPGLAALSLLLRHRDETRRDATRRLGEVSSSPALKHVSLQLSLGITAISTSLFLPYELSWPISSRQVQESYHSPRYGFDWRLLAFQKGLVEHSGK